ncbi:MAG: 23S rRNA (uracil(1939)-C(5))-methyltransferase RlmD [Bacteroidetes bacterium]|nr:23S rRNA (uracil(1939)-C(5))-methyltransferase RlmD [Bacteroidota bacterium]
MSLLSPDTPQLRRGDIIELEIEKAAFEGRCVARSGGLVIFVDGAVPGDRVRAFIHKKKKQFAEARVEELLVPSPHRVLPRCRHFGVCGGCKWQHMAYAQQLRWKREHVLDAFIRIGGLEDVRVNETLPAEEPFWYRNKMEFSFGEMRWLLPDELGTVDREAELFALGLHVPKRYDRILHIDECHLESPESNAILNATRDFFLARSIPAYSTRTHEGDLRHLVIREGKHTGERMVFLVSTQHREDVMRDYARMLQRPELGVSTFVHGITTRKSTVAIADEEIVYIGDGTIREQLGRNVFRISPSSFFQTNTLQAERLYGLAEQAAALTPDDVVWDLYCGTGTIALFIARDVRHVVGVELNAAAIEDARRNAQDNGIENTTFITADIVDFIGKRQEFDVPSPDVIITDPPRAGMHPKVVEAVGRSGVERLVYVSCNPSTSARDCGMLREYGYVVEDITPVDMFPHTWHIECVISLRKTGEE